MSPGEPVAPTSAPSPRYVRDTPEFARVANLSDAVFAIAMTLLVLNLDAPNVPADALAGALADRLPQLVAFVLGFGLVANVWWAHHKFVGLVGSLDGPSIGINLALLGVVALVPFPTSLIGQAPGASAAVIPFIAIFVLLHVLFIALLVHTHARRAWRLAMPPGLFGWLVAGWSAHLAFMVLALLVAFWFPIVGLVLAAMGGTTVAVVMARIAPRAYGEWA